MKELYIDTRPMDAEARTRYGLTDDVMMENAAAALQSHVKGDSILVVCGSGDNGGDGYALARRLGHKVCTVWSLSAPKSESCKRQRLRAENSGIIIIDGNLSTFLSAVSSNGDGAMEGSFSTVVDCIFGSGFHGEPSADVASAVLYLNEIDAFKIACDVPSCLSCAGSNSAVFSADVTVTMGALKTILYDEFSKDYVGTIECAELGIPAGLFESCASPVPECRSRTFVLEEADLTRPVRPKPCVHKGSYGHGAVFTGEKTGAGVIAGSACFAYGAGLVTLVQGDNSRTGAAPVIPPELMTAENLPERVTAAALGMGFGRGEPAEKAMAARLEELSLREIACVLDADAFYCSALPEFLGKTCAKQPIVLTPHPKEFASLLLICGIASVSVSDAIKNRSELSSAFCKKYPGAVLIVKGASPLITVCRDDAVSQFVNPLGRNCLAKGGSGDVLSGIVCALLAQGYSALDAAVQASLAHSLASRQIRTDYGMTPFMLIEAIRYL